MSDLKDPAIKLFGKTIQYCSTDFKVTENNKHTDDTTSNQTEPFRIDDDPKTPTPDKETITTQNSPKTETLEEEKPPQKPDKILPCPRCNSTDTKFCYFNNYNVNQPRHFCRNCQRYWTAGGTMRNTPVGSGRRKNKALSNASFYRHLSISDTFSKNNGNANRTANILNFGSSNCESINQRVNFSNFSHQSQRSEDGNSSSASNLVETVANNSNNFNNLNNYPVQVQIPCFSSSSSSWCYPYNSGFPANFYPYNYWGCNVQLQVPMPMQLNGDSQLGKRSRDGDLMPECSSSGNRACLKGTDSINGGIISKAFTTKVDERGGIGGGSLVNLQANPAALSRSVNFRETL